MKTCKILLILIAVVLVLGLVQIYRKQQEKYGFFDKIASFFTKKPKIVEQANDQNLKVKKAACEMSCQEDADNRKAIGDFDYLVADVNDPFAGVFEFNEEEYGQHKADCMNKCKLEKFRYAGCRM
jgi:hypothetical protein